MLQIKSLFFLLIACNLLAVIVLFSQKTKTPTSQPPPTQVSPQEDSPSIIPEYKFDDPIFAYQILSQLDEYEPVDNSYLDDLMNQSMADGSTYKFGYLGFTIDPHYCQRQRAYFADYPEALFYETNFILDYLNISLVRRLVIPAVGVDLLPNVTGAMKAETQRKQNHIIPHNTNLFFINGAMHIFRKIGENFACLSQSYNHIPGHSSLNRKDRVAESAVAYGKQYLDKPHCFNFNKFFPKTYSLYIEDQCKEFFEHFNSQDYQKLKAERRIVYIKKIGVGAHKAKGVDPVNEEEEKNLRELYANGTKCGQIDKNFIVQHFIHNPLLLDNHKFDFRIYMVIGSTNPTMLYYHDGFLRLSLHEYDVNSDDKSVLLTNTDLSMDTFKAAANGTLVSGMNETELRNFQMWNFTRLHDYLYEKGVVTDPNWLDNYLRPEFKKAMIHLIRMSQYSFLKRSPLFELFGVDFMLDSELNLWFIECNTSPVLKGTSDEKEKFVSKMLRDQFEIIIGLLRSRMKRVLVYVNKLTAELKAGGATYDNVEIPDLELRRKEFKELSMNRFEDEFKPSPENGFSKIIDENYHGVQRYANLLDKDCISEEIVMS